jgi:hypothetical protein
MGFGFDLALIACKQAPTKTSSRTALVGACLQAIGFGFDRALIACKQAPTKTSSRTAFVGACLQAMRAITSL